MTYPSLPPEVNSGLMYTGAGPASLLTAASSWTALSSEMLNAATGIQSITQSLPWQGPSAVAMRAAAATYTSWLTTLAGQLAETASAATQAVGAYETAFAATVPPAEVSANRTQLALLVATNFLGVNGPAIMATEAQYMEMWAQDVAAMTAYQVQSQQVLPRFTPLKLSTGTPTPTTSGGSGSVQNTLSNFLPQSFSDLAAGVQAFSGLGVLALAGPTMVLDEGLWGSPPWPTNTPTPSTTAAIQPAASMGTAQTVGRLSVPQSWTVNAPKVVPPTPTTANFPNTSERFPPLLAAPINRGNSRNDNAVRYGEPIGKVIPRHPSAG